MIFIWNAATKQPVIFPPTITMANTIPFCADHQLPELFRPRDWKGSGLCEPPYCAVIVDTVIVDRAPPPTTATRLDNAWLRGLDADTTA